VGHVRHRRESPGDHAAIQFQDLKAELKPSCGLSQRWTCFPCKSERDIVRPSETGIVAAREDEYGAAGDVAHLGE
jgi:hypothetical protein